MKIVATLASIVAFTALLPEAASSNEPPKAGNLGAILHVPVPLASRGKPIPLVARVETSADVRKVVLHIKSADRPDARHLKMSGKGNGPYTAIISPKTTALASEILYRIEAEIEAGGTLKTKWYPIKIRGGEERIKDAVEKADTKRPGRLRNLIKNHPIATGAGAAVTIGGGIAMASGGGGDSSGGSGGSNDGGTGSSSGDGSDSQVQTDVSGTWSYTNPMPTETITGSWSLTQSGTSISGSFSEEGDSGSVSGSISGNTISLTMNFGDGTVDQVSGTVSGNTMSGSWLETDTGESGTFTASR